VAPVGHDFPPHLPNHNPDQTFYYDDNLLLRRMDYSPDVTGSSPIAHYTFDPKVPRSCDRGTQNGRVRYGVVRRTKTLDGSAPCGIDQSGRKSVPSTSRPS
jgi:hypothetical protein